MKIKDNTLQEIDLLDLLKVILGKWKLLIIAVIVGALLGGGFGVYRNAKTNKEIEANNALALSVATNEADDSGDAQMVIPECEGTYDTYIARLDTLSSAVALNEYEINSIKDALLMYSTMETMGNNINAANTALVGKKSADKAEVAEGLKEFVDAYNIARSNFDSMVSNWSDNQKVLINAVVDKAITDTSSVEYNPFDSGDGTTAVGTTPLIPLRSGCIKFAIIGAFGLLVVVAGCFAAVYVMDGTLKTHQEFESRYDGFCMGLVPADAKSKGYEAAIDMVSANMIAICKEKGLSKVSLFTTIALNETDNNSFENIKTKLAKNDIIVELTESFMSSEEALNSLLDSQQVVLLEKLYKTKCGALDDVVKLIEKHQIDVLGTILL